MKLKIDSSDITFNGKNFKAFFATINEACEAINLTYFVVGAFARDLVLEHIFGQPTGIATRDIDIAIRIDSWDHFNEFIEYLNLNHNFKGGRNSHEFISSEGIITDIIPYGKIEENRKVSFPPQNHKEMNMLGFREIYDFTLKITFDDEVELKVASLEGTVVLKFIAWKDLKPEAISEKHSRDIGLIIDSYFDAMLSEIAAEFPDLFDEENFDSTLCGSRALGRRVKQIANLSPNLETEIQSLLNYILERADNSLFIAQLSNASNWDYSFALRIIKSLTKGYNEW